MLSLSCTMYHRFFCASTGRASRHGDGHRTGEQEQGRARPDVHNNASARFRLRVVLYPLALTAKVSPRFDSDIIIDREYKPVYNSDITIKRRLYSRAEWYMMSKYCNIRILVYE